jgi:nucleoside-diphosphate-sugar epimerase
MKKKILIAGAAGMMASHLVDYLTLKHGKEYDIYGVDDFSGGYKYNVNPACKFSRMDL